jgi:hypothetical protein
MRLYSVVDDSIKVLTTADELTALRLYHKNMQKHEKSRDWGWIDTDEI